MAGMKQLSRRTFLLGSGSMAFVGCRMFSAFERPLFTAGVVTDTHVLPDSGSLERVRRAYRLFAERKVGLVANLGDIADQFCPEAYRLYAEARAAAYPDSMSRPKEVFLWANHDRVNFTPGLYASSYEDSFAAAKPILGITNGMYDRFEMGGYTFLVFPQCVETERYEKMVAEAVADSPGRPVFVMCHVPPHGTTGGGGGEARFTRILSKYPQVVNFCGHSHGTLRDERLIWQGAFTCVNFGCLQRWSGGFLGRIPEPKENWTCAVLEFYADRLVIRRHSLKDGQEIDPDDPWTVAWGDLSRFSPGVRAAKARTPQFPADARMSFAPDAVPMRSYAISFPAADDSRGTLGYRLRIDRRTPAGWQAVALRELCGDFCRESDEPAAKAFTDDIPAAFFDEGASYRCSVEPYGFFGGTGRRIVGEFTAPKRAAAKVVCEVSEGLPKLRGGDKWPLPDAVQAYPKGSRFRIIVDAESERKPGESMNFRMQCFPVKEILSGWIVCETGKVSRRYVLEFERGGTGQKAYLSPAFSPRTATLALKRVRVEEI